MVKTMTSLYNILIGFYNSVSNTTSYNNSKMIAYIALMIKAEVSSEKQNKKFEKYSLTIE